MQQCSLLIVNCTERESPFIDALAHRGFRVSEIKEWPPDAVVLDSQVVIIVLRQLDTMCMLAARMRAKPRFGRRVLLAMAPAISAADRRTAIDAGFDDAVAESRGVRVLVASILRVLRARPEHRCFLPELKRRAA